MPSFQARLMSAAVRALRVKRVFDGADQVHRSIAADRRKGPAEPSAKLRAQFSVRERDVAGRRVYLIGPKNHATTRHVLYLHGGGWVLSIMPPHWTLVGQLVEQLDCTVIVPLYPLAPEHTAPDVLAMLLPFYTQTATEVGAQNLTVMGDCTGANVALALAMQARDRKLPQPARLVLISPTLDASFTNPAIPALDRTDPILSHRGAPEVARLYAGDLDVRDPLISPLFGSLEGLAPLAVFTGTRDILNADAHQLKDKATRARIPLAWFEYPGMLHVWPLFPIPEAKQAIHQMAAFILAETVTDLPGTTAKT
jgi:monoterpene epsilon-lactone hydrolase